MQRGELYIHGLVFAGAPTDPAMIEKVEPESQAARQGLKSGQRIVGINGQRVDSVEQAQFELLKLYGEGTPISIRVASGPVDMAWTIQGAVPRSRPVHPTQLYSLIDALLLCFLLLAYEPYKRHEGELTALVLTIHPVSRFLLEIIRVDEASVFNTGMSISQNISIAIFLGGIALWAYLLWRRPRQPSWPAQPVLAT
jgi:phosphatidylglycerol:prolipoprotein diacylglycerol transferase